MKKESMTIWIAGTSLVISIISIMLWLCKYEPVTWSLLDSVMTMLSLVVAIISVLFAFNMFGLRKELKNEIEEKLKEISDRHVIHNADIIVYIEARLLHLATEMNNMEDIRQSICMMLDATEKSQKKNDVDYVINQLKQLETRYGDKLFDDTFKRKLRLRMERIGVFSDSALLFLHHFTI